MEIWSELRLIVIFIAAANCQDGNTCENEILLNSINYCKNSTGFNETTCSNLECYIACVEDYYGDCGTTDKFFYVDPVVFRVQQRARCYDILYHDSSFALCETTQRICSAEKQATMQQLLDESLFNYIIGNFDVYKNVTCRLHNLFEECIFVISAWYCSEEMANYVTEYKNIGNRISSCGHPQNTTLFNQFDGNATCSDDVTTEQISTLKPTVTPEYPLTAKLESSVASTPGNEGSSTLLNDETSLATHDKDPTTSTTEPPPKIQGNSRGGRTLGDLCTIPTIATNLQDKGCKWPIKFYDAIPDNYCASMECDLACYENSLGNCERKDFRLNTITNRMHARLYCDAITSGRLDNFTISEDCVYSRCFKTLIFVVRNVLDYTNYCKLFESLSKCSAFYIKDECTSEISYILTQFTMAAYDFCSPETSPLFEKYGHPPVATGCRYGSRASSLHTMSTMLLWSFCFVLIGTCLI